MCQQRQLSQTASVAYEKKKKKSPSESIPLNVPPTQSLSAGFFLTPLPVGNTEAWVRGTLIWRSRESRVQDEL